MTTDRKTLREWREGKGLTQEELADALRARFPEVMARVTQGMVAAWESGRMPRRERLAVLREFTGGVVTAESWM